MSQMIMDRLEQSPYKNVYWFARDLVNIDKYGAIGSRKETALLQIVDLVESIIMQPELDENQRYLVSRDALFDGILNLYAAESKGYEQAQALVDELDDIVLSTQDLMVFCFTASHVVAPINRALKVVPSNDIDFTKRSASAILKTLGEKHVDKVIKSWDSMGEHACLDRERLVVVEEFARLLKAMDTLSNLHNALDDDIIMTAFIQEFERRLGQKRKGRGGKSLESAVDFLFEYYKLKSTEKPSHFDQDLEVDKWFRCKDGWIIGISCKRTLRERWKQVSNADRGNLSHHKIKELWHLLTYDADLSDDKIVRLGMQGHVFYLDERSERYRRSHENIGMTSYVRSLSTLIEDVRKQQRG